MMTREYKEGTLVSVSRRKSMIIREDIEGILAITKDWKDEEENPALIVDFNRNRHKANLYCTYLCTANNKISEKRYFSSLSAALRDYADRLESMCFSGELE